MESNKKRLIRIALGAVLFTAAVLVNTNSSIIKAVLFLAPFIIIGGDVILKAFKNIVRGRIFDENFLMSIATVGAFLYTLEGLYPHAAEAYECKGKMCGCRFHICQ